MVTPKTFTCPGCAKRYTWRAQLAGKQAKCICGRMITVPMPPSDASDVHESGLYDIVPDEKPSAAPIPPTIARCPSCGSSLPAASSLCIHCGFDAVIGKKIAPPAQSPRASLAEHQKETAAANKTKIILLAGLLVCIIAGAVIAAMLWKKHSAPAAVTGAGDDPLVEQMMHDQGATELREWLKGNQRHQLASMSNTQALARADELYRLGAKRVVAFGEVVSMSVAVELPDDSGKRKALFEAAPRWMKPTEKPPADVGQKWLLITMPL